MRIILAAALLAISAPAFADTPDVSKMNSDDCARARKLKKTCVLTIEGETVDGKVPTLGDPTISVPQSGKLASLIRIRRDFIVEILKSAEDI